MLKIMARYIAKNVIYSTLLVLLVVGVLTFIIGLLNELRDTGVGYYGFGQAVLHVLLLLPHTLYQFFPMLILLGGVLGLGVLASNQELIVMRVSGVSAAQITWAVINAALVIIVIATLVGELIAPRADYLADKHKSAAQNSGQVVATNSGIWIHEGNNFLHIDRVFGREHLEGVTRYEFDNAHHLLAAYYAASMDYEKGHWVLRDVVKTTFKKDTTRSQSFSQSTWDLALKPGLLNVGLMEPEEMSLFKLSTYSRYLRQNSLQAEKYQFEFWRRAFQPLTTLLMILLAVPFVFIAPRSGNMGVRILFAVIIGFAFYILNAFLGQFSILFQIPPFFAAIFPLFVFSLLGYGLMARART